MLDRFKDAQWIHGVPPTGTVRHETGVYGTLACGHPTIVAECGGHSCNSETMREDQEANARLIAASPDLLAAAKAALDRFSDPALEGMAGDLLQELEEAIAKATGWLVCQDGQHRCFNTDQPCGCRCDDCRDDTEPRCDICNGLINKYGSAIGHCENESDHSGRVHQDPRLRFGPPLDTCIECMEEEASDHTNTRIQVGCGYIIVDREECQNMRHVEEGE